MSHSNILSPEETLDITGALGDPTRYSIYRFIVEAAGEPVTVAEVASQFSLHPNVARMHLQKLVEARLLLADTRRSKAGGRPARIYKVSPQVANLQFPPRDYQMLAEIALRVVEEFAGDDPEALDRVGTELGREEARRALKRDGLDPRHHDLDVLLESLSATAAGLGLHPRVERNDDGTVDFEIRNCIFRELSTQHPELVCSLHTAMLTGFVQEYVSASGLEGTPAISSGEAVCLFKVRLQPQTSADDVETSADAAVGPPPTRAD